MRCALLARPSLFILPRFALTTPSVKRRTNSTCHCSPCELLATLVQRQRGICIAGMHGKTTTTALLAYALDSSAPNPATPSARSYRNSNDTRALWSAMRIRRTSKLFIVESDESDGTLTGFCPQYSVILNVDAEHLDHFAKRGRDLPRV
jgi:UDP-N-acetylmuramate-alanine ligase